jgi:hypothetical protein
MPARAGTGQGDDDAPLLVLPSRHRGGNPAASPQSNTRNMEIKIKGLVRRQLVYGFRAEKDGEGQVVGASVVRLARRNAFELVGLRRPAPAPAWCGKMV